MAHASARKISTAGLLGEQRIRVRRDLRDASFFYIALMTIAFLSIFVFAYLWSRVTVVQLGYDISKANTERTRLVDMNKRLKLEQMRLKSPSRIKKVATGELGMRYPTKEQVIRLK